MTKPNILFVFSDQHRWCDLGCNGNEQVISPNLDAFARKAVRFENCISNVPLCVPVRGTLLTGLLPMKHGAIANDLPIYPDVTSIAHVLEEAGYHTGYIGKWHLAGVPRAQHIPEGLGRLGFTEWKVYNCSHSYMDAYYHNEENILHKIEGYEPIKQTDLAIDFIKRNKDRNWAMYLSWGPPHSPYFDIPQNYLDLYTEQEIKLRDNVSDRVHASKTQTLNKEQITEHYKGYYAQVTALDEQFARLWESLEATGQADNTIVIYTSDHGDMIGSQGLTNKQLPYEESVKVPLMIYWKGKTWAGVNKEMIGLVDLPVSIMGLIGLDFPGHTDGQDLHRLFIDPVAKGLDDCYIFDLVPCHQAADRGSSEWRGVRTRNYTFARTASDDGFVLYDNENDIFQMNNLINNPAYEQIKKELLELVDRHSGKHDELLPWEQLIRKYGFQDEWNRSQAYFKRPLLE